MEKNALKDKTFQLSVSIIYLYRQLCNNRGNEVLARQLLRSATSIGANVREAVYGVSRADFIAKLQIALKETAETEYWIELLQETDRTFAGNRNSKTGTRRKAKKRLC